MIKVTERRVRADSTGAQQQTTQNRRKKEEEIDAMERGNAETWSDGEPLAENNENASRNQMLNTAQIAEKKVLVKLESSGELELKESDDDDEQVDPVAKHLVVKPDALVEQHAERPEEDGINNDCDQDTSKESCEDLETDLDTTDFHTVVGGDMEDGELNDMLDGLETVESTPKKPRASSVESSRKKKQPRLAALENEINSGQLTLRELETLRSEQLPEVLREALENAIDKRKKTARKKLKAHVENGNGPRSVRSWGSVVAELRHELPESDSLLKKAESKLAERIRSHLDPIEQQLAKEGDSMSLKKLVQLERRIVQELRETEDADVFARVRRLIQTREQSHKAILVQRYTKLMREDLSKVNVNALHEFVASCEEELEPEDPLVAQARSAVSARVQEKGKSARAAALGKSSSKGASRKEKEPATDFKDKPSQVAIRIAPNDRDSDGWRGGGKGGDGNSPLGTLYDVTRGVSREFRGESDSTAFKSLYVIAFFIFAYVAASYFHVVLRIAEKEVVRTEPPVLVSLEKPLEHTLPSAQRAADDDNDDDRIARPDKEEEDESQADQDDD